MKITTILIVFACLIGAGRPARAQAGGTTTVTTADIQRLQDAIYDASQDVSRLRARDGVLASDLQAQLDDARDETVYLKVKLRKNEPISRFEFGDLRDRVEDIRSRA